MAGEYDSDHAGTRECGCVTIEGAALTIAGIGAQVTLRLGGSRQEELTESLRAAWSRCLHQSRGPHAETVGATLHAAGEPTPSTDDPLVVAGSDAPSLLTQLTQTVTRALIRAQAGRLLMLHAGAVSHPGSGRSLVFVAAGGTGKTTLTKLLGSAYGYLTDETVAIDAGDRILPYPKPLSVRGAEGYPKREYSPDHLGLRLAHGAPTVGRVLLLERDDNHVGAPDVQEVGLLDGIELLAPQISALYALPRGLQRLAHLRETTGPLLRVRYAEATSLRGLAAELIGEAS